jgi:hypothetical protein
VPSRREIASILFAVATISVDYLVYILFPSIPTIDIVVVTVGILAIATILYITGKKGPSVEEAIRRSTQQKKVADKLDTHYHRIIDRIEQTWDYHPSDGEQIFKKGTGPGQTFPRESTTSTQRPKSLDQDKAHLRSFENAWNLYSDGPAIYTEYKQAEEEARNEIENYLRNAEPTLSHRLLKSLTTMIMERVQFALRIGYQAAPSFEAKSGQVGNQKMIYVDTEMLDVIGEPNPNPWTLEGAGRLASAMNKIVFNPHIIYEVGQREDEWNKLAKNRNDFLSAKDEIVRRARSVDCLLPELTDEGECNDCKPLKDRLKSLGV